MTVPALAGVRPVVGAPLALVLTSLLCSTSSVASFEVTIDDEHDVAVAPIVLLQGDGRLMLNDDPRAVEGHSGFSMPRARLGGRLRIQALSVQVIGEGAREKVGLFEAFAAYELVRGLTLNVGLARSPLFVGTQTSIIAAPIPERSMLERSLWPHRELGIGVAFVQPGAPFEVHARLSNGLRNAIVGNDNAGLAADVRSDVVLRDEVGDEQWRFGVGARVEDTDNEAGIAGVTPLGFQFFRPPPVSGPGAIVEAHFRATLGPARLTLQGAYGVESRAVDDDGRLETPKTPLGSVAVAGGELDLDVVVAGNLDRRSARPRNASVFDPVIVVGARVERLSLGLTPFFGPDRFGGNRNDNVGAGAIAAGGAVGSSAAVTAWFCDVASISAVAMLNVYDTPPIEAPEQATSATLWLRLGVVVQ